MARVSIVGFQPTGIDPVAVAVELWYDRSWRVWVVQRKDAEGNQVGDVDYVATKREAELLREQYLPTVKPCGEALNNQPQRT